MWRGILKNFAKWKGTKHHLGWTKRGRPWLPLAFRADEHHASAFWFNAAETCTEYLAQVTSQNIIRISLVLVIQDFLADRYKQIALIPAKFHAQVPSSAHLRWQETENVRIYGCAAGARGAYALCMRFPVPRPFVGFVRFHSVPGWLAPSKKQQPQPPRITRRCGVRRPHAPLHPCTSTHAWWIGLVSMGWDCRIGLASRCVAILHSGSGDTDKPQRASGCTTCLHLHFETPKQFPPRKKNPKRQSDKLGYAHLFFSPSFSGVPFPFKLW